MCVESINIVCSYCSPSPSLRELTNINFNQGQVPTSPFCCSVWRQLNPDPLQGFEIWGPLLMWHFNGNHGSEEFLLTGMKYDCNNLHLLWSFRIWTVFMGLTYNAQNSALVKIMNLLLFQDDTTTSPLCIIISFSCPWFAAYQHKFDNHFLKLYHVSFLHWLRLTRNPHGNCIPALP